MAEPAEKPSTLPRGLFEDDPHFAGSRMTIGDHIEELRRRVFWAALVAILGFIPWWIAGDWLMNALIRPLHSHLDAETLRNFNIIFLSPQEAFLTMLKASFLAGLISTSPIWVWLLWGFVAAGLYPHEKKWINVFAPASFFMFIGGVLFLYFAVMPWVLNYLISFWTPEPITLADGTTVQVVKHTVSLGNYVTFFMWMSLLMGLVFQTPLVQVFLSLVGMISPAAFAAKRRYVITGAVIMAAILTPPDVVSQLMTAGPFVVLYECGIWLGHLVWRRRPAERGGSKDA